MFKSKKGNTRLVYCEGDRRNHQTVYFPYSTRLAGLRIRSVSKMNRDGKQCIPSVYDSTTSLLFQRAVSSIKSRGWRRGGWQGPCLKIWKNLCHFIRLPVDDVIHHFSLRFGDCLISLGESKLICIWHSRLVCKCDYQIKIYKHFVKHLPSVQIYFKSHWKL